MHMRIINSSLIHKVQRLTRFLHVPYSLIGILIPYGCHRTQAQGRFRSATKQSDMLITARLEKSSQIASPIPKHAATSTRSHERVVQGFPSINTYSYPSLHHIAERGLWRSKTMTSPDVNAGDRPL